MALSGSGIIGESGNILLDGETVEGITLNLAEDVEDEGETISISFYSENPGSASSNSENLIVNGDFESDLVVSGASNWNGNYLIAWTPTGWQKLYGSGVDLLNQFHDKLGGVYGELNNPTGNYVELDGMNNTGIANTSKQQMVLTMCCPLTGRFQVMTRVFTPSRTSHLNLMF